MKKISTYLFFIVLVVGLSFLYSFSSLKNSSRIVAEVVVEFEEGSNAFLTQKMVDKLLIQNQKKVRNQPKSVIDLHELEHSVLLSPYIENAIVFFTMDGALHVVVKQRTPVARINTFNSSYYIDKQGVEVPLSDDYSARVLLVSGEIDKKNVQEITNFVNVILADNFLKKEVVGVYKTPQQEFVLSVRSGAYKIELGTLDEMPTKFKKLKAFYNTAFVDKSIEKYKTINLKYRNQVVCAK